MKRNTRIKEVKARALTDARPQFVSLVKGGANQRPFRAVKMDPGAAIAKSEKEATMTKKSAQVREGHDIAALKFNKDTFADEAAVKAWLDEGGYTDCMIAVRDDHFEVLNTSVQFEPGTTAKVEGAVNGLSVYVGKVSGEAATEKTEDEAVTEHATDNPSAVQPVAARSEEPSGTDDAAKDAAKDEGAEAAKIDLSGIETTMKGMYEVCVMGDVLRALRFLVEDAPYDGTPDAVVSKIKVSATGLIDVLKDFMAEDVKSLEEAFRSAIERGEFQLLALPEAAEKQNDPEQAEKQDEPAAAPGADVAPATGTDPALIAALEALSTSMKEMGQSLKAMDDKVSKTKSEMNERMESIENASQSRKGADVSAAPEEAPSASAQKAADEEARQRRVRFARTMGHPNPESV